MALPSRHRIGNSNPGGLRPRTIPLGHGGSPQYKVLRVDGRRNMFDKSSFGYKHHQGIGDEVVSPMLVLTVAIELPKRNYQIMHDMSFAQACRFKISCLRYRNIALSIWCTMIQYWYLLVVDVFTPGSNKRPVWWQMSRTWWHTEQSMKDLPWSIPLRAALIAGGPR